MEKSPQSEVFDEDFDSDARETIDGDAILDAEAAKKIVNILKPFADSGNYSLEELHEQEIKIKRPIIFSIAKKKGLWNGQEILLGDKFLIDAYLKTSGQQNNNGNGIVENAAKVLDEDTRFFTTDVVSLEEFDEISKRRPALAKKILNQHFYELRNEVDDFKKRPDDPDGFGFHSFIIDNDLKYLSDLKKRMDFPAEETVRMSQKFEQIVARGIGAGNWLFDDGNESLKVGKIKHTFEYDDFINHSDYYCPMIVSDKRVNVVAFDATINSDESNMLSKLDQGTSSQGIPPFGFNYVKYCHIDEDDRLGINEKKGTIKVPLYKISVDFDSTIGARGFDQELKSVDDDGLAAINFLRRVQNDKLFSGKKFTEMRDVIGNGGPYDEKFIKECEIACRKADRLKYLTTSFRVLSEIHEQNLLTLEKNEKLDCKKFRTREKLNSSDIDSIKKIDDAIYRSLGKCMKELVMFNGEEQLINMDRDELYEILKYCSGLDSDEETKKKADGFEHNFGLTLYFKNDDGTNRCYVNMMKCIEAERSDVVYKEVSRNDRGGLTITALQYRKQLENADSEKELARDIFGSMALDSYLDNFEELFQIAKETNSVKAFIGRLGKDDSDEDYGRSKTGLMRFIDDGIERFRTINTVGAKNHDDIIVALFENEEDRSKYFAGRNRDYAAECFSDDFFRNDENIVKLLQWEVGEGRIRNILEKRLGFSPSETQSKVDRLKNL